MNANEFVTKWRASTLTERSSAQQHFLDLCRLLGQPTPAEADPEGTHYTFERGVGEKGGGAGGGGVGRGGGGGGGGRGGGGGGGGGGRRRPCGGGRWRRGRGRGG